MFALMMGQSQSMYIVSDITGIDRQPKVNHSRYDLLLWCVLMVGCSILLLNLYCGLIVNNYRKIKEELENYNCLNEAQRQWFTM